ncbi:MAG: GNAT family N-acetyltransferase [Bacillota bacterium]
MFKKLKEMEIKYVRNFSKVEETKDYIRFRDKKLPNMHMHNFTLIKDTISDKKVINLIDKEIQLNKKLNKEFLRFEMNFSVDENIINKLNYNIEVTKYNYMYIATDKYKKLNDNKNSKIKIANNNQILEDGIKVDIIANKDIMGEKFAKKRINRKKEVYENSKSNLRFFVCYNKDKPIGNCELMLGEDIAKIEDFDIIKKYQRKGFGTSMLKYLMKYLKNKSIKYLYLITDDSDTAKEMYRKCGLINLGQKTELFIKLKTKN